MKFKVGEISSYYKYTLTYVNIKQSRENLLGKEWTQTSTVRTRLNRNCSSKIVWNRCNVLQTVQCLFYLGSTHTGQARLLRAVVLDQCGFTPRHDTFQISLTSVILSMTFQSFLMTSITTEFHCYLLQNKCCYLYFYYIYNCPQLLGTLL